MGQAASPEELEEAKRAALGLMRKAKTMVLATVKPDGTPYAAKVYYALDRGFVFLLEKGGTTLNNVLRTGRAAFTIDLDKPDLFIQGEGVVEVLGEPADFDEERGALIRKVPQDAVFATSGHTVIARLVPTRIALHDMRSRPRRYELHFEPSELVEARRGASLVLRATRYWSFQMSIASLMIGALLAARVNLLLLGLAAVALVSLHGSFNIFNTYFDFRLGVDRPDTLGDSGSRALVDRLMKPCALRNEAVCLLALGLSLGGYLMYLRPAIIPYVALGVAAGLLYSAPRASMKAHALGDLAVFLAFGPGIVLGSLALQGGPLSWAAVAASFALGMPIVGVLHANNWRDIKSDRAAGVVTVASILGERGSLAYYRLLIWAPPALAIPISYLLESPWPLLSLLSVPTALNLDRIARMPGDFRRVRLDQLTGSYTLIYAVLLAAGLLLARLVPVAL